MRWLAPAWALGEKEEGAKERGPLKRCFVLVEKGLRLSPVRGCGSRPAARPSDPLTGRDQTTIWSDGPFLNCSVSCTEPGWVELFRRSWDTPQRSAKINHWYLVKLFGCGALTLKITPMGGWSGLTLEIRVENRFTNVIRLVDYFIGP